MALHARLKFATLRNIKVEAFKHPLVAPAPEGFHGGPVLNHPAHTSLRHTRHGVPVDIFAPEEPFDSKLPGDWIYIGPKYHHFGHAMAETTHRIIPSLKLFSEGSWLRERWLFVATHTDKAMQSFADLPDCQQQVLRFIGIDPRQVGIVARNSIVGSLSISQQGSDLGNIPKAGYLDDLREFSHPRLEELFGTQPRPERVYVSRSDIVEGGSLLGERHIESVLEAEGFQIFRPEQHPLAVQMDVYRKANVLVFAEGSACHGVELLGTGMLGQVLLIVRRQTHRVAFRRVLESRARGFDWLEDSTFLGTAVAHPATGEPLDHMGVSLINVESLRKLFASYGISPLSGLRGYAYLAAAETDLEEYLDHHRRKGTRMLEQQALEGLWAAFARFRATA